MSTKKKGDPTNRKVTRLLKKVEAEISSIANFQMTREGAFRGVLKGSLVRSYEFALYANKLRPTESAFFSAAALRGICEDLIALKFLSQLKKKDRDQAVLDKTFLGTSVAASKQRSFFKTYRPFQPTFSFKDNEQISTDCKDRLKKLGGTSGLWSPKIPLPPIEQMAQKVGLKKIYEFFYSITSEVVHFSPRITMRSGWGDNIKKVTYSTKNFSRYYMLFCQIYSLFLFIRLCRVFRRNLNLSSDFMKTIRALEEIINDAFRWPEAVTFEEMNIKPPNIILTTAMRVYYDDKKKKRRERAALARKKAVP
jgi:hypothetical protein